jgi:ABC-type bacteriocin/lantibiotic exporter with double-glycine peptidase domain
MEKIKSLLKGQWEWIKYTKLGKLIYSLALAFGCFGLANVWDFMFYVGWVFMLYPLGLFCVMMAYAWVINPIRDWKETKKMREEADKAKTETTTVAKTIAPSTEETKTTSPKKRGPKKKK